MCNSYDTKTKLQKNTVQPCVESETMAPIEETDKSDQIIKDGSLRKHMEK